MQGDGARSNVWCEMSEEAGVPEVRLICDLYIEAKPATELRDLRELYVPRSCFLSAEAYTALFGASRCLHRLL